MGQVTSRVPEEVESGLNRWASDQGIQRSELIRQILGEATDAWREGRAIFQRQELPGPADLQRIAARLDQQSTELDRILRQNAKRDADLARQAREDTRGVSEARDTIVADVVSQMRAALELIHGELVRTRDELTSTMQRLPQLATIDATLQRIETLAGSPRTRNSYVIWDREWSTRKVAVALLGFWLCSLAIFYALAMVLPGSWLAVRSANQLLGGGDQAICTLVNYRLSADSCRTQFNGRGLRVSVEAASGSAERAR